MSEEKEKTGLMLKWNEDSGEFEPIGQDTNMDEGVFIQHDDESKIWNYFYIVGASLIARRTALRSANGIAKTGYVHPDGIRYGAGCKLEQEVSPYEHLDPSLKKAQRTWYLK